ncbi:MAG: hypothetical protein IKN57_06250 [Parasporobacterium sp.]|nr:hypothetical protein [Parasporobacterium sp.]
MKKFLAIVLAAILAVAALALAACGGNKGGDTPAGSGDASAPAKPITIGIPNDPTNEARALELLQAQGLLKLKDTGDIEATVMDITENPYNIQFSEIEAAQLPNVLPDLDYAIINSNYAIGAQLTPFLTEGTDVSYPNIIAVKEGNEESDKIKALIAAVNSDAVAAYINDTYKGAIVCDLTTTFADGLDPSVDYDALNGQTITIAASPTPHADILAIAKDILAKQGITLDIQEYNDYVVPNTVVDTGEVDANYFQHIPYLNDFNKENGTHIVSVLEVHHEPMGIYSNKYDSLDPIKK